MQRSASHSDASHQGSFSSGGAPCQLPSLGRPAAKFLGRALVIAHLFGPAVSAEFDAEKYLVYNFGRLSLRPRLELAEVYDSNLFYLEKDEIADLITYVRPGLVLLYGDAQNSFVSLRYNLDAAIYAGLNEGQLGTNTAPVDTTILNYVGHSATLSSRFPFSRLSVVGNDSVAFIRSPLGGTFSYIQNAVGQINRADQWRADYQISPRTLVGLRAGFQSVDYDAKDLGRYHLYDFMGYSGGLRAGYVPSDKVVIFPEVSISQSLLDPNLPGYPEAPTLTGLSFGLGAEGDFTPKLTGLISAGYEMRSYADSTEIPDGWVAEARLRWAARPKTGVTVAFQHAIQVSRETQAYPYGENTVSAGVTQELGTQGRWTAGIDVLYRWDTYDRLISIGNTSVTRANTIVGVASRVTYRWQPWLTLIGSYDFSMYSDNIPTIFDYEVHRISARVVAGF